MSLFVASVEAKSPAAFVSQLNTLLAPLLTNTIRRVEFYPGQSLSKFGDDLKFDVTYDNAGSTIATPFQVVTFSGNTLATATANAQAFISANPSYFFSPIQCLVSSPGNNRTSSNVVCIIYNTSLANGTANWAGGGTAGGGGSSTSVIATGSNTPRTLANRFAETYNVDDYGAIGDGASHLLTSGQAAAYNAAFSAYGYQGANAVAAGDENDWAAAQAAVYRAANTGASVYLPIGTYLMNRPLSLIWSATPIAGQPQKPLLALIYGDGPGTVIVGTNTASGRGSVEILGESNGEAANCRLTNLVIEQAASCAADSWCLRAGDAWCGLHLDRVIFRGANGIRLKVASSVSYANLCTRLTQCQVFTNYLFRWFATDSTAAVQALAPESGGSYWDNVQMDSCIFQGQVDVRAFVLDIHNCQFYTPSSRPAPANINITCYLGSLSVTSSYFEDHDLAIGTFAQIAPIASVRIVDSHFTGINNNPGGFPRIAIQCAPGAFQHGPVTIENCRFGIGYSYSDIDLYGPMTVAVLRCSCPFNGPINTPPVITKTATVRLVEWSPNGTNLEDTINYTNVRIAVPKMTGPTIITYGATNAPIENVDENTNLGASAYAARVIRAGTLGSPQLKLLVFPAAAGGGIANQAWIFTDTANPLIIGTSGTEAMRISSGNIPLLRQRIWWGGPIFSQTASQAVGNTAVENSLVNVGVGSITIQANELVAGRTVRFKARGFISSVSNPTLRMRCKLGSTTVWDMGAVAQVGTPSSAEWELDVEVVCYTAGVGGTVIAQGHFTYNGTTVGIAQTGTMVLDTTAANNVDVTAQWGTAAAGNTITQTNFTPEIV